MLLECPNISPEFISTHEFQRTFLLAVDNWAAQKPGDEALRRTGTSSNFKRLIVKVWSTCGFSAICLCWHTHRAWQSLTVLPRWLDQHYPQTRDLGLGLPEAYLLLLWAPSPASHPGSQKPSVVLPPPPAASGWPAMPGFSVTRGLSICWVTGGGPFCHLLSKRKKPFNLWCHFFD